MFESEQPRDNQHHADQLAVATPHVGLIQDALRRRGVTSSVMDESRPLGLTLLHLSLTEVAQAASEYQGNDLSSRLDRLLNLMYADFERQYNGWTPGCGKNRLVEGAHNIGGGGQLPPTMTRGGLLPRDGDPGRGVRVGIADTALYAHPWLTGAYQAAPASMWVDKGDPTPYAVGHSTFIAGLVLQHAPGATLDVRRVLDDDGKAETWDVAKKLVEFAASGVDILNLSLVSFTQDNQVPFLLKTALSQLDPRIVVVAAAGNYEETDDRKRRPAWPGALPRVLAVGAVDADGKTAPFSPDPELPWVDLMAQGTDVVSTFPSGTLTLPDGRPLDTDGTGRLATWSGTSFSAAIATAKIAAATVPGQVSAEIALELLLQRLPRTGLAAPTLP